MTQVQYETTVDILLELEDEILEDEINRAFEDAEKEDNNVRQNQE